MFPLPWTNSFSIWNNYCCRGGCAASRTLGGVLSNEPLKDSASSTFMLLIVGLFATVSLMNIIWSNSLHLGYFPAAAPDRFIKSLFFIHFEKLSFTFFQSFLRIFSVKNKCWKISYQNESQGDFLLIVYSESETAPNQIGQKCTELSSPSSSPPGNNNGRSPWPN